MNIYASINRDTNIVQYVVESESDLADSSLIKVEAIYSNELKEALRSSPYNRLLLLDGNFVIKEDQSSFIPIIVI